MLDEIRHLRRAEAREPYRRGTRSEGDDGDDALETYGYEAHEGCCERCVGHATDDCCVTAELLEVQNEEDLVFGACR